MNEQQILEALSVKFHSSRCPLMHRKTAKAMAKIKTAQTLIAQAKATLLWAENYKPAPVDF